MPSKLHRVLALQDEPRCLRVGSFSTQGER